MRGMWSNPFWGPEGPGIAVYDIGGSEGSVAPPPPPPPAPPMLVPSGARYGYLVARLRNRQITMEEATELFGLLQESLATAGQAMRQMAGPSPPRPAPRAGAPTGPPAARPGLALHDEDLALGMLAFGMGAGLLAAILKRSADGPPQRGSK
ncbi:MAG TPA: hypothetical protein VGS23_09550 [Thermoplasmata archaeon]|nr:hypothetical protein [Thermoplasmata archaeon]